MVYNYIMRNYQELKDSQPYISNQDFSPVVVDGVLLPDQIDRIYSLINSAPESKEKLQMWAGHKAWDVKFPKDIEDRITLMAQSVFGEDIVLDRDYSFARYSPKFGYRCKLFPHYDTRGSQRITFDIQLRASEPWSVVVEEVAYPLKDNQALMFAGTQQIHWREKKEISPDAEIDMIFCHLVYKDDRPLDDNQQQILDNRADVLMKITGISNQIEELDRK